MSGGSTNLSEEGRYELLVRYYYTMEVNYYVMDEMAVEGESSLYTPFE